MGLLYNRAKMTVSGTPGTGTITLGTAFSPAFFTFDQAGVPTGASVSYVIEDGGNIELGNGTYTASGTTLSRDVVTASKIGGTAGTTKLTLTSAAVVYIDALAADIIAKTGDTMSGSLNAANFNAPVGSQSVFGNIQVASAADLGAIYFGSSGIALARWIYYNGTQFQYSGGGLYVPDTSTFGALNADVFGFTHNSLFNGNDLNTINVTCWVAGSSMGNAPSADYWFVETQRWWDDTGYKVQRAMPLTSTQPRILQRHCVGGTWYPWYEFHSTLTLGGTGPFLPLTGGTLTGNLNLYASTDYAPQIILISDAASGAAGYLVFGKRRGAAPVQVNDSLGSIVFQGRATDNLDHNTTAISSNVLAVGADYVASDFSISAFRTDGAYLQLLNISGSALNTTVPINSGGPVTVSQNGFASLHLNDTSGKQFQIFSAYGNLYFKNVTDNTSLFSADATGIALPADPTAALHAATKQYVDASVVGGTANGIIINGTLAASVAGNALTVSLKTLTGADPSAGSPVTVLFRNATAGNGTHVLRQITSALSLTISSGSTLGTFSATPGRVWIVIFDDAGTMRLGAINVLQFTSLTWNIFALQASGIASSTAEGGAGAADNPGTFYTGTAVTSKAYRTLGSLTWNTALTTAGTWNVVPGVIEAGANIKLPGTIVQTSTIVSGGSTITSASFTTITNSGISIYPTAACNIIEVNYQGKVIVTAGGASTNTNMAGSINRNAASLSPAVGVGVVSGAGANLQTEGAYNVHVLDNPSITTQVIYTALARSTTTVAAITISNLIGIAKEIVA